LLLHSIFEEAHLFKSKRNKRKLDLQKSTITCYGNDLITKALSAGTENFGNALP